MRKLGIEIDGKPRGLALDVACYSLATVAPHTAPQSHHFGFIVIWF